LVSLVEVDLIPRGCTPALGGLVDFVSGLPDAGDHTLSILHDSLVS
jgi:hypothetical protein